MKSMRSLGRINSWVSKRLVLTVGISWVIFLAYVLRIGLSIKADELSTARIVKGYIPHSKVLQFMVAPCVMAIGSIAVTWLTERRRAAGTTAGQIRTES